jgi:hypothetical protein
MQADLRIELALLAGAAALTIGVGLWFLANLRPSPAERERRRRLGVDREGRVWQGILADIEDNIVHYSYTVGGVTYNASQDVSALQEFMPADAGTLGGTVQIKYLPRNPPNSIVVCENWSGLRPLDATARATRNH